MKHLIVGLLAISTLAIALPAAAAHHHRHRVVWYDGHHHRHVSWR